MLPLHRRSVRTAARPLLLLLVCVALLLPGGCNNGASSSGSAGPPPKPGQPRLVILYAPCSVSKQYLSPYNDEVRYTPQLQAFADDAVVFTKHRTEAGLSGIAYASLITGSQATEHGIFAHPTTLSSSIYDITEAFADNDYDVFFWNHQKMGSAELNYAQAASTDRTFAEMLRPNDARFASILERLKKNKRYKAFVFVNYRVNHNPYLSDLLPYFLRKYPEEAEAIRGMSKKEFRKYMQIYYKHDFMLRYDFDRVRRENNLTSSDVKKLASVVELLYKSNIPRLDTLFGEVVAKVDHAGLKDESLIAFTVDHGESMFLDHAPFKWSHAHALRAEVLDVPLMIRAGKKAAAGRRDFVTRSIDIFPTLATLAMLDLDESVSLAGYDLSKSVMGRQENPELSAFSHTGMIYPNLGKRFPVQKLIGQFVARYYPGPDMIFTWVAVRKDDTVWKYRPIRDRKFEFQAFDLQKDPTEANNIFNAGDPQHQEMAEQLKQYKESLVDAWQRGRTNQNPDEMDAEERLKRLRDMGYVK